MKANELRLGNYVHIPGLLKSSLVVGTIEAISKEEVKTDKCEAHVSLFQPIPLTEEWLIKFGFEKIGSNYRKLYDYGLGFREFVLYYNTCDKNLFIKSMNYRIEIELVHQLQNLYFSLTENELIMKP